jgi:hypothetical protein
MSTKKHATPATHEGTSTDPAQQAAYDDGYEVGYDEGYDQGYADGLEAEREDDETMSEEEMAEEELYQKGHTAGSEEGYARGWNDAIASDGVYGSAPDPDEKRPLRRIVAVYSVWGDEDRCNPQLSCGHVGPDPRSARSIEKDIAARRRMHCGECDSDK